MAHPRFTLGRILNHAVGYALLGSVASCGGQAGLDPDTASSSEEVTSTTEQPPPQIEPTGPGVVGTESNAPTHATNQPVPTSAPVPPGDPTIPAPELTPLSCEGIPSFQDMTLSEGYDFIALRRSNVNGISAPEQLQAQGTACANASDETACKAALEAAWPETQGAWTDCGQIGCINNAVVLTKGDEVKLIDTRAGLHALLGTIDNQAEAVFWADASGYTPVCGETRIAALEEGGFRLQTSEMVSDCPVTLATVTFDVHSVGDFSDLSRELQPATNLCVGRRSPTLVACERGHGAGAAGRFFADVAALEASAVEAFRLIAEELTAFGAPDELVRAALAAADDEVRHARITGELARAHGNEPTRARFAPRPPRTLFEFALDNAIEGCVRETYGAACARYQAATAADPATRALLARIADDEQRHAELSWQLQAWLAPRLSEAERLELASARERALAELRREVASDPAPAVIHHAGMPSAARAAALLDALEAELWATPLAA